MESFEFNSGRNFLLSLDHGKELLGQLKEFLVENGVRVAYVSGIGAVISAEVGYYDQKRREYVKKRFDERAEILNLNGNVSIFEGEFISHVHVVLGYDSRLFGGHLFAAKVFACELFVLELVGGTGKIPERNNKPFTGYAKNLHSSG
jgi:hypothetical protein